MTLFAGLREMAIPFFLLARPAASSAALFRQDRATSPAGSPDSPAPARKAHIR
jgi:hypothetical protein